MKVLFCTDGSDISLYAIDKALKLIKKDFVIDIATVIETGFLTTFVTFPYQSETGFPEYRNKSEEALDNSESLIKMRNFRVDEKYLIEGHPADELLGLIQRGNYAAVILGSHGKKGFKKWLGSVSSKIAQRSTTPVLVVKPLANFDVSAAKKEFLMALDGSKNSYNAMEKAIGILDFEDVSIELLSVKSAPEDFPVEIRDDRQWLDSCLRKQDEIMEEIFESSSKLLEEHSLKEEKRTLLEGDPAEQILLHVEKYHKDLVIMGSHGRHGLSSFILGSVSKVVLEHSHSPVMIIYNKP